ncbi:MAG TPA: DUF5915 domain-containing protein, partial [Candidatus Eisenbacteria bacterium]
EAAGHLAAGEPTAVVIGGHDVTVQPGWVEVLRHPAEGLALIEQGGLAVAVDTRITEALTAEGRVRELVHRLQGLRKDSGLSPTDRIHVDYWADSELARALAAHEELVREETLARTLSSRPEPADLAAEWDVDGLKFRVSIRPAGAAGEETR